MGKAYTGVLAIAGTAFVASTFSMPVLASEKNWGKYQAGDRRSGYTYMTTQTMAIQDDDLENPGMLMVDEGEILWSKVDGEAGKSCASCHDDASESMKGVATGYPKYDPNKKGIDSIETQINECRTERMKAKPYKWESNQLLAMTTYVRHQSHGMPMNVSIDGDAVSFFEKGKAFYYQRRGQLDFACKHCHEDNPGMLARANRLSEGMSNGFPTYRLKWQKVGSLHRRFRGCNKNIRATPYAYGAPEYLNLELYLAWRARGLPVEAPAVRM